MFTLLSMGIVAAVFAAAFFWSRKSGYDEAKKEQAIDKAMEAYDEAQRIANQPHTVVDFHNVMRKRIRDKS